jgi:hypothetical protein
MPSETESLQRAEVEGRQAASNGLDHKANPYAFPAQGRLHMRWVHAWLVERAETEEGIKIHPEEEVAK